MKIVDYMPQSGSFIAVWGSGNKLWSHTLLWIDEELYIYVIETNKYVKLEDHPYAGMDINYYINVLEAKYIVKD